MSVIEHYTSRSHRITRDGHTITAIWILTWREWDQGYDDDNVDMPYIGEPWTDREDLFCSDINVNNYGEGKDYCIINAIYSTEGTEFRTARPNQTGSWDEGIDIHLEEQVVDAYEDTSTSTWKKWSEEWVDGGGDAEIMPMCVWYIPRLSFRVTTYGNTAYIARIKDASGKINSVAFLTDYLNRKELVQTKHKDDIPVSENDINKWLMLGCNMQRLRADCWRFDFHFLYDGVSWNIQHGIKTNMYETYDFRTLLNDMDKTDDEEDIGLHS